MEKVHLNRMGREEMVFELRPEGWGGTRSFLGSENSKQRSSEAEVSLAVLERARRAPG